MLGIHHIIKLLEWGTDYFTIASDRSTARRIQICLLLIELSLAAAIVMAVCIIMKLLPFSKSSWTSKIFSTLAGIWIAKSTIWALYSMKNRSVYEGNNDSGHSAFTCEGEDDCLKSFQSMHERKAQTNTNDQNTTQRITFEGKKKHQDLTNPPPSKEITNTKTFLQCLSDKNEHTSKISFPLLALMATVVLQSAVCLFVNIQNF